MCMSPTRAATRDIKTAQVNGQAVADGRTAGRRSNAGMRLTLVGPGVIQVVEYRNQNIQHIAALQDEEQEFLSKGHKGDSDE